MTDGWQVMLMRQQGSGVPAGTLLTPIHTPTYKDTHTQTLTLAQYPKQKQIETDRLRLWQEEKETL